MIFSILVTLGILLVISVVGIYGSFEITRIPFLTVPFTPQHFGWVFEEVSFKSFDSLALKAWFVPAAPLSTKTIFILHGIGSNAGDMLLNTECLHKAGKWNLFYINFRGHGGSEGAYASLGPLELRDFESAVQQLRRSKPEACQTIAVYGHSLGGAVAVVGATVIKDLQAVAAESPFSYISKTVRHFSWVYYGIPYFPFIPLALFFTSLRLGQPIGDFAPARAIGKIAPRPVYLIQAEQDARMPMKDSDLLWEAAKDPKERWVVPRADHGEPWVVARDEYERRLVDFFVRYL